MNIKVDHRQCNENLLSNLRKEKNIHLEICQLPIGDYQVEDFLLVERKTIHDLYVSIKDGRFFGQAKRLSSHPIQPLLILEGTSTKFYGLGLTCEAVQGALISLSLLFKIPLIRSKSPQETAGLILYASRQIQGYGSRPAPYRYFPFSHRRNDKYKRQIHILQGFPGIGPARARVLLERYGTLKGVFSALTDMEEGIPGIGNNIIRKIMQVME